MLFKRAQIRELQNRIGVVFRNLELYERAFTHRSYLNENRNLGLRHNELLEFRGDSALEESITEFLMLKLPDAPEGMLTNVRGAMVNWRILAQISEELELGKFLFMSRGERAAFDARERSRGVILANTFEALVGAIRMDRGPGIVDLFLDQFLFGRLKQIIDEQRYLDPKSCLQELAQEKWGTTPRYRIISVQGPDHDVTFTTEVVCGERQIGKGAGGSRVDAEMEAADNALREQFQVSLSRWWSVG
jgi:ribonuclease-3